LLKIVKSTILFVCLIDGV